jgi:DNA-binding NarL/FixJ family response regulator
MYSIEAERPDPEASTRSGQVLDAFASAKPVLTQLLPTRVFIAQAVRLYREGLELMLSREPALDVVGTSAVAADIVGQIAELTPDVVVLDVGMTDGLKMAKAIRSARGDVKIVALAVSELQSTELAWAEAGVSAYVTDDASVHQLVETIHRVRMGEVRCSPRVTARLLERLASLSEGRHRVSALDSRLTQREDEIVSLIGAGLSNKEIARQLCISLATVKNHVHNILTKLEVPDRRSVTRVMAR